MISEQPFLFVIFALSTDGEVLCITHENALVLPRYEFQLHNESEAITDALQRQIRKDTNYEPNKVILTDYEVQHTDKGKRDDTLFRTCLVQECVRCDVEKPANALSPFPFVQWAGNKNYSETFESFEVWNAREQAHCGKEKTEITLIPFNQWNDMVESKKITDALSVIATERAIQWMAFEKQTK